MEAGQKYQLAVATRHMTAMPAAHTFPVKRYLHPDSMLQVSSILSGVGNYPHRYVITRCACGCIW
jgi:hypothetical protein